MVAAVLSVEPSLKISTFCVYKSCRFLLKIPPIVVECGKKKQSTTDQTHNLKKLGLQQKAFFKLHLQLGLLHVE